ncbi:MAG: hypothetical protein JRN15_17915, partial [Nitrososphaerota archaeon]|nr:hypothetical protein [Nitrososphaerota archaeon]
TIFVAQDSIMGRPIELSEKKSLASWNRYRITNRGRESNLHGVKLAIFKRFKEKHIGINNGAHDFSDCPLSIAASI